MQSKLVSAALKMRQQLTRSSYDLNDLMKIYQVTNISEYFEYDASLGGYVAHERRLRKRNYFV